MLTCPFSKVMITESLREGRAAKDEGALMVRCCDHVISLHHMRAELAGPKYQSTSPTFRGCRQRMHVPEMCNILRITSCTVG